MIDDDMPIVRVRPMLEVMHPAGHNCEMIAAIVPELSVEEGLVFLSIGMELLYELAG
jgi:hypothetical protein